MKHVNIPVFVPHLGCPGQCVFCDQRAISGVRSFVPEDARQLIESRLSTLGGRKAEIAFFGGTFTGIGREKMTALLDLAEEYAAAGRVTGIRFSTRPDFISPEIVKILSPYSVTAVELGIQSSRDRVLALSGRGHTAEDSRRAAALLRDAGYPVVGQMMLGLPGAEREDDRATAEFIADCGASAARIYPTLVFRGTELYSMTQSGRYRPLTEEEAVQRGADALSVFARRGVECIRIGLPDSACENADVEPVHDVDSGYAAGPRHPAMGERIRSAVYGRLLDEALRDFDCRDAPFLSVSVCPGEVSAAVGYRRENQIRIENKYNVKKVKFIEKTGIPRYNTVISRDMPPRKGGSPHVPENA